MIVGKAVQMAQMMHVPILGLVENTSYAVCPDCGKHINVFGDSHVDEIADKYKLPVLAKMPIDPELAKEADAGIDRDVRGRLSGQCGPDRGKAAEKVKRCIDILNFEEVTYEKVL